MSGFLDKLNLRPQERRIIVIAAVVVFVVVNVWLVFPRFGELGRIQQRIHDLNDTLTKYQQEVGRKGLYEKERNELKKKGYFIPSEERALQLARDVGALATLNRVNLNGVAPVNRTSYRTNAFFEEQAVSLNLGNTREKELVTFLYSLGERDSLTRVRNMDLRADPSQIYLVGSLIVVRNFQRKMAAKTAVSASHPTAAAAPAATATNATRPAPIAPPPTQTVRSRATTPQPARSLPTRTPPKPIAPK
jgi:hypothetical protein